MHFNHAVTNPAVSTIAMSMWRVKTFMLISCGNNKYVKDIKLTSLLYRCQNFFINFQTMQQISPYLLQTSRFNCKIQDTNVQTIFHNQAATDSWTKSSSALRSVRAFRMFADRSKKYVHKSMDFWWYDCTSWSIQSMG